MLHAIPMIYSSPRLPFLAFVATFVLLGTFPGVCMGQEMALAESTGTDAATETTTPPSELPSFEELKKDPEYLAELTKRTDTFEAGREKLAAALTDQHAIMVRYRNGEATSKADQENYFDARQRVRDAMDELYVSAMELSRIAPSPDAAQFLVTMIKHRTEHGIYNLETAEGAARLIDGGGQLLYLFQAASRSAVVGGQFDIARKVYDAMSEDQLEDVDRRFSYGMDQLEENYLEEQEILKKETEADNLPQVKLRTSEGDVVLELFLDQAPSTVASFIKLVEEGFYDGLDFHQVIDDLLVLTGDPSGLGDGNSGKFLIDENDRPDARHGFRGSLVMAKIPTSPKSSDFFPNSSSSQFAIMMIPILGIEKQQTVFGRVIEGMNNLAALRRVDPSKEKKKGEITLPSDYIIEATVVRRPEVLPEPKYLDLEKKVKELIDQNRNQADPSNH